MEALVNCIFRGEPTNSRVPLDVINTTCVENIEKSSSLLEFEIKIKSCKNNMERIQLVWQFFEWIPLSLTFFQGTGKNELISNMFKEKGNVNFEESHFEDALRCYTLSIMFYPEDGNDLGHVFASRAEVLLSIGRRKECLQDLEYALEIGCPDEIRKFELESRLARYRTMEGPSNKEQSCPAAAKERQKRKKFCEAILFRVKNPRPESSVLEEFVEEGRSSERGRMLMVSRDIPAGTVLLVEKPYACVLSDELKWTTDHCHHCFKKLVNGIGCQSCTFKLYCNATCRDAAKIEYHANECGILPYLHAASTPRYALLALRIILKLGAETISNIYKKTHGENVTGCREFGESADGALGDYFKIQSLVSHAERLSAMEQYSNTLQALCLVSALDEYTEFFKRGLVAGASTDKGKELFQVVAATLLFHLESVPCNAISLDEFQGIEKLSLEDSLTNLKTQQVSQIVKSLEYSPFGAGMYGITSIINHSCDPNATRIIGPRDGILSVVATRRLRAGEEICASYSKYFGNDAKKERIEYLEANYFFTCNCIACRFNWQVLPELLKVTSANPFCCKNCSNLFKREDKTLLTGFSKCILKVYGKPRRLRCDNCSMVYSVSETESEFEKNLQLFHKACQLVTTNMPLEGIRLLFGVSKYFESGLCPPFGKSVMCQNIFKHALQLIVHYS